MLYVDKARQDIVRPLVLSWGNGFGMNSEFGWIGMCNSRNHYLCTLAPNYLEMVHDWWVGLVHVCTSRMGGACACLHLGGCGLCMLGLCIHITWVGGYALAWVGVACAMAG